MTPGAFSPNTRSSSRQNFARAPFQPLASRRTARVALTRTTSGAEVFFRDSKARTCSMGVMRASRANNASGAMAGLPITAQLFRRAFACALRDSLAPICESSRSSQVSQRRKPGTARKCGRSSPIVGWSCSCSIDLLAKDIKYASLSEHRRVTVAFSCVSRSARAFLSTAGRSRCK